MMDLKRLALLPWVLLVAFGVSFAAPYLYQVVVVARTDGVTWDLLWKAYKKHLKEFDII